MPRPRPPAAARGACCHDGRVTDGAVDAEGGGVDTDRLPPGQRAAADFPVLHYGPVPRFRPETWDLRVFGATASGEHHRWTWPEWSLLPRVEVVVDLHCVTGFSVLGSRWRGVAARTLLDAVPPAPAATHVVVWADYGYSANLPLDVLADPETVFASHRNGAPLTPDHGHPVRLIVPGRYAWKGPKWVRGVEYVVDDRRGFWEERGYHNVGDPWREQRYTVDERPGDGPPL